VTPIGLSLEQIRRAVILGITSIDDFQTYLVRNKYTVDAQAVLLAELRDAVTEAEAARAKRAAAAGATVETRVPLATVARAARLGIVTPDVYEQRLTEAGYTDDDIAIEMDLLAVEIADFQAARARADAAKAAAEDRGLSLDQLARAVKLGVASIDDYRSRAVALNYAAADVDTLVAVLEADVQAVRDAEARRATIDGQLKARNLSLSELEAAVKAGQMTIDAYTARLVALGYGSDDADLAHNAANTETAGAAGGELTVEPSPVAFVGIGVTVAIFLLGVDLPVRPVVGARRVARTVARAHGHGAR
jgi:uncharacterized membrane protein (GlpM family)